MDDVKRVLVTGASGGIGLAIVKAVLAAGYQVVAHYNSHAESLKELQAEYGDKIQLIQFNVADRENCKTILEKDVKENGAFFGVVLSSGICRDAAFPAMTMEPKLFTEDWISTLERLNTMPCTPAGTPMRRISRNCSGSM